MRNLAILLLTSCLAACASSVVVVRVASQAPSAQAVRLEVNDLRAPGIAASTRQAAFGVPMGNITFDPPERQLVRDAITLALGAQPAGTAYSCDIVEFGVNTQVTPLYWDVVATIRLNLRKGGRTLELSGNATERTFIWPGEDVIRRVVQQALQQAAGMAPAIDR